MFHSSKKKLRLNRVTLRNLEAGQLGRVASGWFQTDEEPNPTSAGCHDPLKSFGHAGNYYAC